MKRGHSPLLTPVDVGGIVLGVELGLVIREAIVAIAAVGAVFGQGFLGTVAPLVGAPVEEYLA